MDRNITSIGITERISTSLHIGGRLVELTRPWVMGIVNATPDSFFAGSRCASGAAAATRVARMLADGADIIDLGACSTRSGAAPVSEKEETERLDSALEAIRARFPEALISIDTYRAAVARHCVERWHADMINDISAGDLDPEMAITVAELKVPYVAMHTRGTPDSMQQLTDYDDVTAEVLEALARKVDLLHAVGIADVIVDPGFGFAKSIDQNYQLLGRLPVFRQLRCPLLVGISRKTMIWKELGIRPDEALNGTTVLNTLALIGGASILRVHDVKEAVQAVTLFEAMLRNLPADFPSISTLFNPDLNPDLNPDGLIPY